MREKRLKGKRCALVFKHETSLNSIHGRIRSNITHDWRRSCGGGVRGREAEGRNPCRALEKERFVRETSRGRRRRGRCWCSDQILKADQARHYIYCGNRSEIAREVLPMKISAYWTLNWNFPPPISWISLLLLLLAHDFIFLNLDVACCVLRAYHKIYIYVCSYVYQLILCTRWKTMFSFPPFNF